jgi:two-component system sensor histidine kinase KdpD
MMRERRAMDVKAYSAKGARMLAATGLALLTTLGLVKLGANSTAAGMVFLVLVVWSATQAGIWLALFEAVLCALVFDYFFLLPYRTLLLAGVQEWVEMLSFVACSLVVGRVAELARRQTRQAEQRREDVERLYELSQQMMLQEDAEGLIQDLPRMIDRIFALQGVALYVSDQDQFYSSTGRLPEGVKETMRGLTQGHNPTLHEHGGFFAAALMLGMRPVGALGWRPPTLSREVAAAVCAQVSIALARSIAVETSARMEAAREGERLRTALIDSLTHELRTPLTSIRAAATTLLQTEGLDEAGRLDLISIVDEEAARLDILIGEAVEMAEVEANVVQVHLEPQHPRALLDQAVEESRKALAGHKVTVDAEDGDEPAWFDPHLLGRVLRHLLENAGAHTPAGALVTLKSWREGSRLEFSVEDTGPGIDSIDLPLVFEKFYRGKKRGLKGKGSGMGLAITRSILEAHGGGIEARSAQGKGTIFQFWVPLVEKEPAEEGRSSETTGRTRAGRGSAMGEAQQQF